jgi:oligopeptide/dipeptide ABC transporter ATP-binding protein
VTPVLEVGALVTSFPADGERVPVVDGIDLRIERGEVLALVGESGCGKTVAALSCLRLVPKPGRIDAGRIAVDGREILPLSVPEMRRVRGSEISMIFQEPMTSLNPVAKVGDQVVEAIRLHERVSRAAARGRTLDLFRRVGIPDPEARLAAFPHQLSGGLKQRVMIAMALVTVPKLLIADEPTTALDVTIQAQILQLLRDLQREFRMAIWLITHDLGIVNELADRVAVMYAGRIVEEGTRLDVLARAEHPYARGLLRSMPPLATPGERLAEIPGVVPPPDEWPPGCRFASRCERAFEPCEGEAPAATSLSQRHRAWCHAVALERGA